MWESTCCLDGERVVWSYKLATTVELQQMRHYHSSAVVVRMPQRTSPRQAPRGGHHAVTAPEREGAAPRGAPFATARAGPYLDASHTPLDTGSGFMKVAVSA